ncbi:hypothetical protein KM043_013537 [Ampulex compressa]|nr:hypothetical protein KM043_013537 [Ampulex compressa]
MVEPRDIVTSARVQIQRSIVIVNQVTGDYAVRTRHDANDAGSAQDRISTGVPRRETKESAIGKRYEAVEGEFQEAERDHRVLLVSLSRRGKGPPGRARNTEGEGSRIGGGPENPPFPPMPLFFQG